MTTSRLKPKPFTNSQNPVKYLFYTRECQEFYKNINVQFALDNKIKKMSKLCKNELDSNLAIDPNHPDHLKGVN